MEHPGHEGDAEHAGGDAERQPHPAVGERREQVVVGGDERGGGLASIDAHHRLLRRCRSSSSNTPGTTLGSPDKRVAAMPSRLSVARVSSARRRAVATRSSWSVGVATVEVGDVGAGSDDVEVAPGERRIGHRHVADGAVEDLVLGVEATQQARGGDR